MIFSVSVSMLFEKTRLRRPEAVTRHRLPRQHGKHKRQNLRNRRAAAGRPASRSGGRRGGALRRTAPPHRRWTTHRTRSICRPETGGLFPVAFRFVVFLFNVKRVALVFQFCFDWKQRVGGKGGPMNRSRPPKRAPRLGHVLFAASRAGRRVQASKRSTSAFDTDVRVHRAEYRRRAASKRDANNTHEKNRKQETGC